MKIEGTDAAQGRSAGPAQGERAESAEREGQGAVTEEKEAPERGEIDLPELEEAVQKLNSTVKTFEIGLRFVVREEPEQVNVQVVNRSSSEVMKEIPPQNFMVLVSRIQNIIGLLVDTHR